MIEITTTNDSAPRINGTVMEKNRRTAEAPSILAAWYSVSGTPCIAASNTTVAKGTLFHTLTRHSDPIAQFGSISHGIGPTPIQPSMMLSSPLLVLNTNCHTTAITTDDTAKGKNIMTRKVLIPLAFRLSTPATARLISTVGTTVPTV